MSKIAGSPPTAQLSSLFLLLASLPDYRRNHNIPAYPRNKSCAAKPDAVAINAARDWQTRAVQNHRLIYIGTSDHMPESSLPTVMPLLV